MLDREKKIGDASFVVIGVGGAGNNAVNYMLEEGIKSAKFVGVDTDTTALNKCLATTKILLGEEITQGLGSDGSPEIGEKAALEGKEQFLEVLKNADMVFITAGMGGGTGTGAAPIIAEYAKEVGALTVGLVSGPFAFEGKLKAEKADTAIEKLKKHVDTIMIVENESLLTVAEKNIKSCEAFKMIDEILCQAVEGVLGVIKNTDYMSDDVRSVMQNAGSAIINIGRGKGDKAVAIAVESAMKGLMFGKEAKKARSMLFTIVAGKKFGLADFSKICVDFLKGVSEDGEVFYGVDFSDELADDEIITTVIATRFDPDTLH